MINNLIKRKYLYFLAVALLVFALTGCNCINQVEINSLQHSIKEANFADWKCGQIPEHLLWNFPIFWWGRIGEILQMLGGLLAIADLIGRDGLVNIATKLSSFNLLNKSKNQISIAYYQSLYLIFGLFFFISNLVTIKGSKIIEERQNLYKTKSVKVIDFNTFITSLIIILLLISFFSTDDEKHFFSFLVPPSDLFIWTEWVENFLKMLFILLAYLFFSWLMFSIYSMIIFLVVSLFSIIGLLFGFIISFIIAICIFQPLIFIVSHRKNEEILKIIALFLVFIGFLLNLSAT